MAAFWCSSSGSVLDAMPQGPGFDPTCSTIFINVFTLYSLVFIVICDLFSLTFILVITSTRDLRIGISVRIESADSRLLLQC